jgi:DNA-binding HxlR family transcriptional regulator
MVNGLLVTNKFMSMESRKINSTNFENEVFLGEKCVLNKVLKLAGQRWISEILLLIERDVNRFSSLKLHLAGISDNVLSGCLSKLVTACLVNKKIFPQIPLKAEYGLSANGEALMVHLHQLCNWGKENGF